MELNKKFESAVEISRKWAAEYNIAISLLCSACEGCFLFDSVPL